MIINFVFTEILFLCKKKHKRERENKITCTIHFLVAGVGGGRRNFKGTFLKSTLKLGLNKWGSNGCKFLSLMLDF